MKHRRVLIFSFAMFLLVASCNNENTGSREIADSLNAVKSGQPITKKNTLEVTLPEAEFATRIAAAAIAKLALSKLAVKKTKNPTIKIFAENVVKDLQISIAQLNEIGDKKEITLPKGLDDLYQKMWDDLKTKTNVEFDEAYLSAMAQGQQQTKELLIKALPTINDATLKTFAQEFLEKSNAHLRQLNSVKQ